MTEHELDGLEITLDDWISVTRSSTTIEDPDFLALPMATQGLLLMIWLYEQAKGSRFQVRELTGLARQRMSASQIAQLRSAGFIDVEGTDG